MNRRSVRTGPIAAVILLVASAGLAAGCARREAADLVIRNARVYTAEGADPWAGAVAVKGDRIAWVGGDREAGGHIGEATRVVDAGGRLVLPGFIDSHNHIFAGDDPEIVRLSAARTFADLRKAIREFADAHPDLPWIEGEGFYYQAMPEGRPPRPADLDGLTGGRPAFLIAYDYHTAWLNREALGAFGITRKSPKVPFAETVEVDPKTGEPTGVLISLASAGLSSDAAEPLRRLLPSYKPERRYRRIKMTLDAAVRFGITTIVEPQSLPADLEVYARARDHGDLRSRLQVALYHPPGFPESGLAEFDALRKAYDDDRLRVAAVKLYIDDVIEAHTAAMLEPYADRPETSGRLLYEPAAFNEVVARLDRMKFQIFIHAIGDRGVRTALDALEHARSGNGPRDSRHQLVHIECLSRQDVPRFAALGVVACMQPRHSAWDIGPVWREAVGPARHRNAWTFRSLKEAGATLAFASDWNVAEMDPMVIIYTAVTRRGIDGEPEGGWIPEEAVDVETAVRAFTINGAWANFVETNRGSIAPGKYADLVMLSDDLFRIAPEKIREARVILTLVGGREVHRAM